MPKWRGEFSSLREWQREWYPCKNETLYMMKTYHCSRSLLTLAVCSLHVRVSYCSGNTFCHELVRVHIWFWPRVFMFSSYGSAISWKLILFLTHYRQACTTSKIYTRVSKDGEIWLQNVKYNSCHRTWSIGTKASDYHVVHQSDGVRHFFLSPRRDMSMRFDNSCQALRV